MTKKELEKRIQGLNEYMLSDNKKKLLMLSISSTFMIWYTSKKFVKNI